MSIMPLVSIVIPCYNHEKFVQNCIQSIINQSYKNIELIIIDDGSKDNSVNKIKELIEVSTNRFVRFEFRHRNNKGLCATLNEALEWCEGKYFSVIASDDIMLENKTKIQVDFLNKENYIAVFGGVHLINENNEYLESIMPSNRVLSFNNIILSNYTILAPTQMIRMSALSKLGKKPYPEHLRIEDWYMWLKLSEMGEMKNLNDFFVSYRNHNSNSSNNFKLMHEGRRAVLNEFKDNSLYRRASNIVELINYLEINKFYLFIYLFKNPKMIFDCLFYKHVLISFVKK